METVLSSNLQSCAGTAGVLDQSSSGSEASEESEKGSDAPKPVLDSFFDDQAEPQVEKHFGTEFWISGLEETVLKQWESVQLPDYLHVPAPNNFIATDFTILQEVAQEEDLSSDLPAATVPGFPTVGRLLPTPAMLNTGAGGIQQNLNAEPRL